MVAYSAVQTGANTRSGGLNAGFLSVRNHVRLLTWARPPTQATAKTAPANPASALHPVRFIRRQDCGSCATVAGRDNPQLRPAGQSVYLRPGGASTRQLRVGGG